jgi:hypothetical protein
MLGINRYGVALPPGFSGVFVSNRSASFGPRGTGKRPKNPHQTRGDRDKRLPVNRL